MAQTHDHEMVSIYPFTDEQRDALLNGSEGRPIVGINIRPINDLFTPTAAGRDSNQTTKQKTIIAAIPAIVYVPTRLRSRLLYASTEPLPVRLPKFVPCFFLRFAIIRILHQFVHFTLRVS